MVSRPSRPLQSASPLRSAFPVVGSDNYYAIRARRLALGPGHRLKLPLPTFWSRSPAPDSAPRWGDLGRNAVYDCRPAVTATATNGSPVQRIRRKWRSTVAWCCKRTGASVILEGARVPSPSRVSPTRFRDRRRSQRRQRGSGPWDPPGPVGHRCLRR